MSSDMGDDREWFAMRETLRLLGGWPTARLARQNGYHCFGCCRATGPLVVKERREDGQRSYGVYHRNCVPVGRRTR